MTNQQFMAGVWQKAEALAVQERELRAAQARNRALRRRTVGAVLLILAAAAILVAVSLLWGSMGAVQGILAAGLLAVLVAEGRNGRTRKRQEGWMEEWNQA